MDVRKKRSLIIIGILWILILLFNFFGRKLDIIINYAPTENGNPNGLTTLYYDCGSGYQEKNSVYETINDCRVQYTFKPFGTVRGIRIIPTRKEEQSVNLENISIYINEELIGSYEKAELYSGLDQNTSAGKIVFCENYIEIQYMEGQPWPYVTLSGKMVNDTNCFVKSMIYHSAVCMLFWLVPLGIVLILKRFSNIKICKENKALIGINSILIVLLIYWIFQKNMSFYSTMFLAIIPFLFMDIAPSKRSIKKQLIDVIALILSTLILCLSYDAIWQAGSSGSFSWAIDGSCLVYVLWMGNFAFLDLLFLDNKSNNDGNIGYIDFLYVFVIICGTFVFYEYVKLFMQNFMQWNNYISDIVTRIISPIYLMNIFWGNLFLLTMVGLFGYGMAFCLYGGIFCILLIGNIIKIHYHNTLLTPMDFLQWKEMLGIARTTVGDTVLFLIIFAFLMLVLFLYLSRKAWVFLFKKRAYRFPYVVFAGFLLCQLTCAVVNNKFEERGIFYKGYENEFNNENTDGVAFYNIINISKVQEIFMKKPDGYSKEAVLNVMRNFEVISENNVTNDKYPNIILIMAESLFDIENVNDLEFNKSIEPTLKAYQAGNLISPRYGGYTSAVEYEALTGLTLAFYPSGLVPYTTYFNQKDKKIPSIVHEFNDNGYLTYALHPNEKTFYNRDTAYKELGFQEFLDINSFVHNEENTVARKYLKDMPIAEKIVELISENEKPVFTFAVTLAGHYMNENRYEQTDIKVMNESLSPLEKNEVEQTATAYHETDEMFRYLVDYIQSSDEPTLLYIFGDHLPPLPALTSLGYINDINNKYSTMLSTFSNYKEIIIPQQVTPNQLAAQVLIDSGVVHSTYYDYIFSLRKDYPVIHKEFLNVEQNEDLELYKMIQYDVMFGEQWFYKLGK